MNKTKRLKATKWQAFALLVVTLMAVVSCSYSEEKAIEQSAMGFADNYFNMHYREALAFCTPESAKWVRFKASNITQENVDCFNEQTEPTRCSIESIELDDEQAEVEVEVQNYLNCDTIGKPGIVCPEAKFRLSLRKANDRWLVDIQEPIKETR